MRKFEEMKQIIGNMEATNYAVPDGIGLDGLIADMLHFMGTTDSDLREGIYSTFMMWCEETHALSPGQMRHVLNTVMDEEHLFYGIGESGTDSVFMRAFSSLVVCVAIYGTEDDHYLTEAERNNVKDVALRYIAQEKDYRGYVKGKGWAHAIAHAADMLNHVVWIVGREGVLQVLDAIAEMVSNRHIVFDAQEDERLADAAHGAIYSAACERDILTIDEICDWLNKLGKKVERVEMPEDYNVNVNRRNFMKSLYFNIWFDDDFKEHEEIRKQIFDTLLGILNKEN